MIEQTELVVTEWQYTPPANTTDPPINMLSEVTLDVMQKRASTKKGIACRFTCHFTAGDNTILKYVGEDSYVIDLPDIIDANEVRKMIRNSYSKFTEKFDFRKQGTVLQNRTLMPLDESTIDINTILPLLNTDITYPKI